MFLGQYEHSIDSKGRLTIPARFRDALENGAVVTQGFERNLMVYTTEAFQRLAQRASSLSTTDPQGRAIRRILFGGAADVTLDSVGRILIPPFLRSYAGVEGEVAIVGAGDYIEIWNTDSWAGELESVTDSELNARRFSEYDISAG
ncbi:MAG: division/cell wall cluster transcriptional repressor MraZ [Anaerolineales bacterium]|nr:division/cell wall cluster transcriptional repressor MraZ [Anaerolineales bacterium]